MSAGELGLTLEQVEQAKAEGLAVRYWPRRKREGPSHVGRVLATDGDNGNLVVWLTGWHGYVYAADCELERLRPPVIRPQPGIGAVVAMVAAAHQKTALYRQTLRCHSNPHDDFHTCMWCKDNVF